MDRPVICLMCVVPIEVLNAPERIAPESLSVRANLYIYREVYLIRGILEAPGGIFKRVENKLG